MTAEKLKDLSIADLYALKKYSSECHKETAGTPLQIYYDRIWGCVVKEINDRVDSMFKDFIWTESRIEECRKKLLYEQSRGNYIGRTVESFIEINSWPV